MDFGCYYYSASITLIKDPFAYCFDCL